MNKSSSQRTTDSTSHESGSSEETSCWDRLVDRLLPSDTENPPVIRDPKWQERAKWTVFALSWLSWLFGLIAISGCNLMKIGDSELGYGDLDSIGLFQVAYYSDLNDEFLGCISYDSAATWDRGFKTSRAMAVLMMMCLTAIIILITPTVLFLTIRGMRLVFYYLARFLILPALVFNCFMFIFFGRDECAEEDTKCPPGAGGILAMMNVFIIAILAVLLFVTPVPAKPALGCYTEPESSETLEKHDVEQPKPKKVQQRQPTLAVPELRPTDQGVDMKVQRTPEGLKVSQRIIHTDGTKTVSKYVKKIPTEEQDDATPDEIEMPVY